MKYFPMHPAGLDTKDPCDSCHLLFLMDDMTLVEVSGAAYMQPGEQRRLCDECVGETE